MLLCNERGGAAERSPACSRLRATLCPQLCYPLQEKAVSEQRKPHGDPTALPRLVPSPIHPSWPRQAPLVLGHAAVPTQFVV